MPKLVQLTPIQGVDPEQIQHHFDVSVYWLHSKATEAFQRQIREAFPTQVEGIWPSNIPCLCHIPQVM